MIHGTSLGEQKSITMSTFLQIESGLGVPAHPHVALQIEERLLCDAVKPYGTRENFNRHLIGLQEYINEHHVSLAEFDQILISNCITNKTISIVLFLLNQVSLVHGLKEHDDG